MESVFDDFVSNVFVNEGGLARFVYLQIIKDSAVSGRNQIKNWDLKSAIPVA